MGLLCLLYCTPVNIKCPEWMKPNSINLTFELTKFGFPQCLHNLIYFHTHTHTHTVGLINVLSTSMQDKSGKVYFNYFAARRFILGLCILCRVPHCTAHTYINTPIHMDSFY